MAIRGKKTSGIRNVGNVAFRSIKNSEERDFGSYARRVFEFRGLLLRSVYGGERRKEKDGCAGINIY